MKTEQVKKLIIRHIRESHLMTGDRLPPQSYFRQLFGCGTATVNIALQSLRADGILEVRDKVGVYLVDPQADGMTGRTIGLTARWTVQSLYYNHILASLQMLLIKHGCQVKIFPYSPQSPGRESATIMELTDFPGLRRSVESGEVEGIIHLDDFSLEAHSFLRELRIPTVFIGSIGTSPNGIFYDQPRCLKEMLSLAKRQGHTRQCLIIPSVLRQYLGDNFLRQTQDTGIIYTCDNMAEGRKVAKQFLALPVSQRPDLMIFFDDLLAHSTINSLLLQLCAVAMPKVYLLRNRQLQQDYPIIDPEFFDIDMDFVTLNAVKMLMDGMRSDKLDLGKILVHINHTRELPAHKRGNQEHASA